MTHNPTHPDNTPPTAALAQSLSVGPTIPIETWRLSIPAAPACYLLLDADENPILLATTANLRNALTQRLSPPQPAKATDNTSTTDAPAPSPRIDYHNLIHAVRHCPVHSRFEADLAYLHNVHQYFPQSFDKLTQRFGAHWLHINMDDEHPQFVTVDRPVSPAATCFGPIANSKTARLYIQTLEDIFKLCRKHKLLLQTPHAKPCDYKAMSRCTAPCDGTIPYSNYRQQLQNAINFITQPQDQWRQYQTRRMKHAAADQQFEIAQQAKQQLKRATYLNPAPPPLTHFQGLILTQGPTTTTTPATPTTPPSNNAPKTKTLRPFAFKPGAIQPLDDIPIPTTTAQSIDTLIQQLNTFLNTPPTADTPLQNKLTALLAWHTLHGQAQHRLMLPILQTPSEDTLTQAIDTFLTQQQKPAKQAASFIDNDSDPET